MTDTDLAWLTLRESADLRARNGDLASRLNGHFAFRDRIAVVDIGCGTAANLRACAPLLPSEQHWTLIDRNPDRLAVARSALVRWADHCDFGGDVLRLSWNSKSLRVMFHAAGSLEALPELVLTAGADLVTTSSYVHQLPARSMQRIANASAKTGAVVYAVLTYNGQQAWLPRHPLDTVMRAAYHAYQIADHGEGQCAGPVAPSELADALAMSGYSVSEAPSDWTLGKTDALLINQWALSFGRAVETTGQVNGDDISRWLSTKRNKATVGHVDILAFPPAYSAGDFDDESE